jgi:hypothetical protein
MRCVILMLALIWLPSCQTVQKADDVLAWVKGKTEVLDTKIENLKANQEARVAKFEGIVGAWDRDGDGSVSVSEAKAVVADAAKTPDGRRVLLDPEFWAGLSAAVLGLYGAKRAVLKLYHGAPEQPPPNGGVAT